MILLSTSVYLEYLEGISIGNLKIISFGKFVPYKITAVHHVRYKLETHTS